MNGELLLQNLRKTSNIPVIMVISRNTEVDEFLSMSYGADDYITKLYNPTILLLRVEAIFKRMKHPTDIIKYKDLNINLKKGIIQKEDTEIILTKNEMIILNYLLNNQNKIVTRDESIRQANILIANYKADTDKERKEVEKLIYDFKNHTYINNTKINVSTKLSIYENSVGLGALVTFIGLYLGIIFLISSAAILALKELSESSDNKERFRMLRRIGTDEKMINRALFRQTAIFFMFPLLIAIVHSIFGIIFCNYILSTFGDEQLLPSIIMSSIFIIVIYGGYFLITYLCSKNIIKER